ncbi:hypothetical protein N9S00_06995 [Luminiphilus sp.]|nr:hypothetical protein [Luminiphilus sp.]
MDLPKYVKRKSKHALYYRRKVPKDLQIIAGKVELQIPLEVDTRASATAIQSAAAKAALEYDAAIQLYSNSDRDTITDSTLDAAASAAMRAYDVKDGEVRPEVWTLEGMPPFMLEWMADQAGVPVDQLKAKIADGWADRIVDDMPDHIPAKVKARVKQRISRKKGRGLSRLSQAWPAYCQLQGWDADGQDKNNKRRRADWERLLRYTGDHQILPGLDSIISKAMTELVHDELERIQPQSIRRNLATPLACARWIGQGANIHPWQVDMPRMPANTEKVRQAMTRENQIRLLSDCEARPGDISAVIAFCMTGGIPSELLNIEDWSTLEGERPYVATVSGKTTSRPRLICFPFAQSLIRERLESAADYVARKPDHGVAACNKRMVTALGEHATTYQLRHAARLSGMGENPQILAGLLGWAGGLQVSKVMLRYGSENMEQQFDLLWDASCRIFGHLKQGKPGVLSLNERRARNAGD